jgi:hypothetical protein
MAAWAYECRPCEGSAIWHVACDRIDAMPPEVRILRVRSGTEWLCAIVDRRRPVQSESLLLRDAVASDAQDCPQCAALLDRVAIADEAAVPAAEVDAHRPQVQAAAISIRGQRMLVVLVGMDLIRGSGEADMAVTELSGRFGGVDVVLMGQDDDGAPHYHGRKELVQLVTGVPIDRMPWESYPLP